jgi:hypothetical protein
VEPVIGPATSGGTRWLHPGYIAEVTNANASTGIRAPQLSMDHRIKSGGDE